MSSLRKILALMTPAQRRRGLGVVGLILVGMFLEMLGISLVMPVITLMMQADVLTRYPQLLPLMNWLGNPGQSQLIVGSVAFLVSLYCVKAIFLVFLAWQQNKFVSDVHMSMTRRLYTGYLQRSWVFHLQRNSAQLIATVTSEAGLFAGSGLMAGVLLITESLMLLGVTILLLALEPLGTLLVVLVVGGATAAYHQCTRRPILKWGENRQYHEVLRMQYLQEGFNAAKDVKVLGREKQFISRFVFHDEAYARALRLQNTLTQVPRLWLELLAIIGLAVLVTVMISQARPIADLLPVVGVFAAATFRLMPSMSRLLGVIQNLRYGLPVLNKLYDELQIVAPETTRDSGTVPPLQLKLQLENVTYQYPDTPSPAIRDVTLRIERGACVGLIGGSGAGKSTLVDVMLGLLTPNGGRVLIDGVDIQQNVRQWQRQIGYVPQTIYLTDDTLRRNIAFGVPDQNIDESAIARALQAAQLVEFVASLPCGLDTLVGERGVRLSGGQRQRIGIARALYHNPPVLVLDEATSSLDAATEQSVMVAVDGLHREKTLVIVAHRLSTVANCDVIYRLKDGRVVDYGDPEQMLGIKRAVSN